MGRLTRTAKKWKRRSHVRETLRTYPMETLATQASFTATFTRGIKYDHDITSMNFAQSPVCLNSMNPLAK